MATDAQIGQAARTRKPGPAGSSLSLGTALTVHHGRPPPREFHDGAERELLTVRPYAAAAQRLAQAGEEATG